ncbi:uncharacterized protein LOC141644142 isoform X2 [Silene latifolia]|uniref:uncharacterized protein LOC141644142 isoform X2 n=1 Tax=Silene latifolia TaxID=37657 RepID=UPI003D7802D8
MSGSNDVEMKDQEQLGEVHTGDQAEETKNVEYEMPSVQQEEEMIKKKYGGLIPKKKPLISKDHEHAFFDSADWALGKGANKPKGPLEALRPKLQPTPHHQARSRRSAYAPADGEDMHADQHDSSEENDKTENVVSNDETSHG